MDMARQAVLIRAYLQSFVQANPVSDADIRKEYDSIKARLGEKEYKARHILVDTEDQAKAIIAKLQAGEKFEDLAKESMILDQRSAEVISVGPTWNVRKPFSDAMISLEKANSRLNP